MPFSADLVCTPSGASMSTRNPQLRTLGRRSDGVPICFGGKELTTKASPIETLSDDSDGALILMLYFVHRLRFLKHDPLSFSYFWSVTK